MASMRAIWIGAVIAGAAILSPKADAASEAWSLFQEGRDYYVIEAFDEAAAAFEKAVRMAPRNSSYHHWLGKAYGRLAERANWLSAIDLAAKTRDSFERAVELNGNNIDALADLREYYLSAPAFLGGSRESAEQIREQLEWLAPREE